MASEDLTGQTIRASVNLDADSTLLKSRFATLQAPYALSEAEFERLKSKHKALSNWAFEIIIASLGAWLLIIGKALSGNVDKIDQFEIYGCVAALFIGFFLGAIGNLLPNARKTTMKKIEAHFKSSPGEQHVVDIQR